MNEGKSIFYNLILLFLVYYLCFGVNVRAKQFLMGNVLTRYNKISSDLDSNLPLTLFSLLFVGEFGCQDTGSNLGC